MCVHKTKDGICQLFSSDGIISYCVEGPCDYEANTNADKIRSMSDEELTEFLVNGTENICELCPLKGAYCEGAMCKEMTLVWLKQPMEE